MTTDQDPALTVRWARLRFAIIGPLLAAPPPTGELHQALLALARKTWKHPVTGADVRFGVSTVERWYYAAKRAQDPVKVLRRRRRHDAGQPRRLSPRLRQVLKAHYQAHPGWTVQLHYDNLAAHVAEDVTPGPLPAYGTVRRYMKAQGLHRRRPPKRRTAAAEEAALRLESREVRSFEAEYTHGLWHLDFHHGSRKVLTAAGEWITPRVLGVIDDHSRLICHLQWYRAETAEVLVHGLSQAFQKRGLPRALVTDNGPAMQAEEFCQGLCALSILHQPTLPYSPHQNAKQETFRATLEGRLMALLEGVGDLTLERLNAISQAWVEQDYHRNTHAEIGTSPLRRYLDSPNVGRDCPDGETLQRAFRTTVTRRQRRSDGTVPLAGIRFEVPARYRHLEQLHVRYARWNLRAVDLIDPHTDALLCPLYPLDKTANADARRRRVETTDPASTEPSAAITAELPPLLRKLLAEYAATGRPPAFLPFHKDNPEASS